MAIKFGGKKTATAPVAQEQVPAEVAKPVAAPVAPVNEVQVLTQPEGVAEKVDAIVKVNAKVKAAAPDAKEFAGLKKELQLIADETGNPAEEVVLEGSNGAKVVYGAKNDQNSLNPGAMNLIIGDLKKVVSMEDLFTLITVSQETVKQYLGEDAVAKYYTKTANTGARSLKAVISG